MAVTESAKKKLPEILKKIRSINKAWSDNYDRFHTDRDFVYRTNISMDEASALMAQRKPVIQANILEGHLSRQCAEFDAQERAIYIRPQLSNFDKAKIAFLESYCRKKLYDAKQNNTQLRTFQETTSGGFSVWEIYADYKSATSMEVDLYFGKVEDPTLCGFDVMAQYQDKRDAEHCFKMLAFTKEDFKEKFPDADLKKAQYSRSIEGFEWAYQTAEQDVILVCDFYEKKKKKVKIVELVKLPGQEKGETMTQNEYDKLVEDWEASGRIELPPAIVQSRWTTKEIICLYRICSTEVLSYEETKFSGLPLIFVDGNSQEVVPDTGTTARQMTRSIFHNAFDTQRLKNYAMQALAAWFENMTMHKWKVAIESLPDQQEYRLAYKNVQQASVLVYKSRFNNQEQLPPPQEIAVQDAPPELRQTFDDADKAVQSILGSFDSSLGIFNKEISGKAIQAGAMQSSAAARIYPLNYNISLARVFGVMIGSLPRFLRKDRVREFPVVDKKGNHSYQSVNNGELDLDYEEDSLNIDIEVGVNYELQKVQNMEMLNSAMAANPGFAQFIAQECLDVYVKNIAIRGDEELEERAVKYMQAQKQAIEEQKKMAQQQMQAQASQPNPLAMKAENERMKLQLEAQQNQIENQIEAARLANEKQSVDNETLDILSRAHTAKMDDMVKMEESDAKMARAAVDEVISKTKMQAELLKIQHNHSVDKAKILHEIVKHNASEEREDEKREMDTGSDKKTRGATQGARGARGKKDTGKEASESGALEE